ncbi:MAG: hypothetical protein AVDCRST_MAG45-459, partial [uncultured Solirubrobacterales bacterium]
GDPVQAARRGRDGPLRAAAREPAGGVRRRL